MISLKFVFWMLVGFTALIGLLRGAMKELLVLFAAIAALMFILVTNKFATFNSFDDIRTQPTPVQVQPGDTCESIAQANNVPLDDFLKVNNLPLIQCNLTPGQPVNIPDDTFQFYYYTFIILISAFAGYETPRIKFFQAGSRRENVLHAIFGGIVGGVNGYMIFGSILYYLRESGYEYFYPLLSAPTPDSTIASVAAFTLPDLPPEIFLFQDPMIYVAILIVVFVLLAIYV